MGNCLSLKNQHRSSGKHAPKPNLSPNLAPNNHRKRKPSIVSENTLIDSMRVMEARYIKDDTAQIDNETFEQMLEKEDPVEEYYVTTEAGKKEQDECTKDDAEKIKFLITPRQNVFRLSDVTQTKLGVMASVRSDSFSKTVRNRAPLDLICVIDRSGSMQGDKILLVQESLKYLLKILGQADRLCLIEFNGASSVLTPLLRNNEKNRETFDSSIENIEACGSTNIASGINNALTMISKRRHKNPITCVFLLSDGADDRQGAESRVHDLILKANIYDNFTIHTFGYGNDHDPMVMRQIAQEKDGNFHYIENITQVDGYFVLSLSGLLSIIAEKVEIRLQLLANQEHQFGKNHPLTVSKLFGGDMLWSYDKDTDEHVVKISHLLGGVSKDFLLEIQFPALRKDLNDLQKKINIMSGTLKATFVESGKEINLSKALALQLINPKEKINDLEENEDVEVNYFRVKSAEVIGEAAKLGGEGKYEEGKGKLQAMIQDLEKSKYKNDKVLKTIIKDCSKAFEMCEPSVFENKGMPFMFNKERGHMMEIASCADLNYDNSFQEVMMENLKNEKD